MQAAFRRAPLRPPTAALRPLLAPRALRPLSSSLASCAAPHRHRPSSAATRRRDPLRILSVPRRKERSEGHVQGREVVVEMPEDGENVLRSTHAARTLLETPGLIVTRQLEALNLFVGFEQANKYTITDLNGVPVGYLAEEESMMNTVSRQALRTRRPFRAVVLDLQGKPVLWIRRPFQWINSRIYVHSSEGPEPPLVGEAQQSWHLWRRRYDLFKARQRHGEQQLDQFATIDEGLWAWDFWAKDEDGRARASINRNFGGLGREIFTDTGAYVLRFEEIEAELAAAVDPAQQRSTAKPGQVEVVPQLSKAGGLSLDERAVLLATAISIDFDYFSRHSGHSGMGVPFFFPFFGGGGGGSELDSASSEGAAPEQPSVPPAENDVPLPRGMRSGSIADELAREDAGLPPAAALGGASAAGTAGAAEAGAVPEERGAGDGPVPSGPEGLGWWERELPGQDEGELMEDPWAVGGSEEDVWGGGDGGSGDSGWP